MKPRFPVSIAIAFALSVAAPPALAQTQDAIHRNIKGVSAIQPPGDLLRAAGGNTELKCTQSGAHVTCTSEFVWVCPAGWSACPSTRGVQTCCTK
jgi:hypothetical protein